MQEKYGFVYIWYDRKHKRFYIGAHWGHEDDGYVCSSKWMLNAYKIRPEDFGKRKILERIYTNKKDTFLAEHKWLQMIKPEELKVRYYNSRRDTSLYWIGDKNKSITRSKRQSVSLKTHYANNPKSDKYKEKISSSLKEYYVDNPQSEATKTKRSKALKGRIFTEEHRKKLSEAASARKLSEKTKQKISETKSKAPAKRIYYDKKRDKYLVQYQRKTIGRFPTIEGAENALTMYMSS